MEKEYDLEAWLEKKRQKELAEVKRECQNLIRHKFVALDLETTGLESFDEIVQIGIVDYQGQVLMDLKVRPEVPIAATASKVHGLYWQDVTDAPLFPDIHQQLQSIVGGRVVVIYNAAFDKGRIRHMTEKHCLPTLKCKKIADAFPLYNTYIGQYDYRHKSYRWQPLPGGNHTGMGDAMALVKLIYQMSSDTI